MQTTLSEFLIIIAIILAFFFFQSISLADQDSNMQKQQNQWTYQVALILVLILIGFITVIAFTFGLSRQSATYNFYLTCFTVYLVIMFILLFGALIQGANLQYGNSFGRRMYLYDPATQSYYPNVIVDGSSSSGQIITLGDFKTGSEGDLHDGQELKFSEIPFTYTSEAYIIKNGTIISTDKFQQVKSHKNKNWKASPSTLKDHNKKALHAIKTDLEPILVYTFRYLFLLITFIGLIFILLVLTTILMFLCFELASKCSGRAEQPLSIQKVMFNGRMMNVMKRMPYSTFMLREARDCPICLDSFRPDSQVVQLKCSRYHIIHYECIERYLNDSHELSPFNHQQLLCPLCRKQIEAEDLPVISLSVNQTFSSSESC